jgi:hypothetical protein
LKRPSADSLHAEGFFRELTSSSRSLAAQFFVPEQILNTRSQGLVIIGRDQQRAIIPCKLDIPADCGGNHGYSGRH